MLLTLVILVEKQKNSLKNGSYPLRRNCIDTKQEFVAIAGRKDLLSVYFYHMVSLKSSKSDMNSS